MYAFYNIKIIRHENLNEDYKSLIDPLKGRKVTSYLTVWIAVSRSVMCVSDLALGLGATRDILSCRKKAPKQFRVLDTIMCQFWKEPPDIPYLPYCCLPGE